MENHCKHQLAHFGVIQPFGFDQNPEKWYNTGNDLSSNMENTNKKYKILKERLSQLYFLTEEEIEDILVRAKEIKEEAGLDELIKLFDEAKSKQDDMLGKMIKEDESFVGNLKRSLSKMYQDTTDEITKQESEGAEELLKDL